MKGMLQLVLRSTYRPGMGSAGPGSLRLWNLMLTHSMVTPLDAALITISIGHSGNAAEACSTQKTGCSHGSKQSKSINVCGHAQ